MWYFLSQKVDGKMIFTIYWKVLVLNFPMIGNMAFFGVKELIEKIIFTDYRKVLVLNFSVVGNTVFFWVKKLMEKMIFTGYQKVLVLKFSVMGNTIFSSVKKFMERWYLLGLFELFLIFQDLGNTVFGAVFIYFPWLISLRMCLSKSTIFIFTLAKYVLSSLLNKYKYQLSKQCCNLKDSRACLWCKVDILMLQAK